MPDLGSGMTRILVADDSDLVRRSVCELLRSTLDFQVVGEAADGMEAIARATELQPDIVLLDVQMPNMNGIGAVKEILEAAPNSSIIFLTQYASRHFGIEARRMGAHGYVTKAHMATCLVHAIECAMDHEFYSSIAV